MFFKYVHIALWCSIKKKTIVYYLSCVFDLLSERQQSFFYVSADYHIMISSGGNLFILNLHAASSQSQEAKHNLSHHKQRHKHVRKHACKHIDKYPNKHLQEHSHNIHTKHPYKYPHKHPHKHSPPPKKNPP